MESSYFSRPEIYLSLSSITTPLQIDRVCYIGVTNSHETDPAKITRSSYPASLPMSRTIRTRIWRTLGLAGLAVYSARCASHQPESLCSRAATLYTTRQFVFCYQLIAFLLHTILYKIHFIAAGLILVGILSHFTGALLQIIFASIKAFARLVPICTARSREQQDK